MELLELSEVWALRQIRRTFYGNTWVFNARYRWDKWAVGAEWLSASKLIRYFYTADEDLFGFYRSPGMGKHVYLTRKFAEFLTLRVGFREKDLSNFPVTAGPIRDTDRNIKTSMRRPSSRFLGGMIMKRKLHSYSPDSTVHSHFLHLQWRQD